jgi:hypothetical protein
MSSERGKVFFFEGGDKALYCTGVRVEGDVITGHVVNGGWYMHLQGDTLKACHGRFEGSTHFEWESNSTPNPDWENPVHVQTGVELSRTVDVPARVAHKLFEDYNEVINWARPRSGDAAVDALSDIRPEHLEQWGVSPVVAVGYNRTDSGHYMTPSMKVPVSWNPEGQRIELSSGARSYGLSEYLNRLVENQTNLCRVWLMRLTTKWSITSSRS